MKEDKDKQTRVTVRLSPNQMQCLNEMSELFNTNYSQLIRMMVCHFLIENDAAITRLLNKHDGIEPEEDYGLSEDN